MVFPLVVGSTAAKVWFPDWREPKDLDVFSHTDVPGAEVFWDYRLNNLFPVTYARYHINGLAVATRDELYTIKISHSFWDLGYGSWEKHANDAAELKKRGCRLLPDVYRVLYEVWEDHHGSKRVDLNMSKEDFFADAVTRKYDHDSIHRSVAYTAGRPMYERALAAGETVRMDMAVVKLWPVEDQVKLFREEIYATALERWVIPSNYRVSPKLAYARALKKTVVSLTKGWSSLFIMENYDTFRVPDMDYVRHHVDNSRFLEPLNE